MFRMSWTFCALMCLSPGETALAFGTVVVSTGKIAVIKMICFVGTVGTGLRSMNIEHSNLHLASDYLLQETTPSIASLLTRDRTLLSLL